MMKSGGLTHFKAWMRSFWILGLLLGGYSAKNIAAAHEQWGNGSPVPAWVHEICCGVSDAHRLTIQQIQPVAGGWAVDGFEHIVPNDRVLPSEDEFVWIFYKTHPNGVQSQVFCFFVPQGST